jgi:hypothetical protein
MMTASQFARGALEAPGEAYYKAVLVTSIQYVDRGLMAGLAAQIPPGRIWMTEERYGQRRVTGCNVAF